MEHRHGYAPQEYHSLRRRLTAGLLAGAALSTIPSYELSSHDHTPAGQVFLDTDGKRTAIGVDMTVVVPSALSEGGQDRTPQLAREKELRATNKWCETPESLLGGVPSAEQLKAAATLEMGLEHDDYQETRKRIWEAESKAEAWNAFSETLTSRGAPVTLNQHKGDFRMLPEEVVRTEQEQLQVFKTHLMRHLRAFTYLPKSALNLPPNVDFVDVPSRLIHRSDPVDSKGAGGLHYGDTGRIVIHMSSDSVIHEYGHEFNRRACLRPDGSGVDDGEMKTFYEQAIDLLDQSDLLNRRSHKAGSDASSTVESTRQGAKAVSGFPTNYSKKSAAELMAELTEELLLNGSLKNGEAATNMPYAVQQLVAERIEAATGDDMSALLDVKGYYGKRYNHIPIEELVRSRVSPYGTSFEQYYGVRTESQDGAPASLKPAIEVRVGNDRSEIIYAYHQDVHDTSDAHYASQYAIGLKASGDKSFDDQLVEKSQNYLEELIREKGLDAYVETRRFDYGSFLFVQEDDRQMLSVPKGGAIDAGPYGSGG